MFKFLQYRARAAAYGVLAKNSAGEADTSKFERLQDSLAWRADNERVLADQYVDAVNAGETERLRGAALATEEERVLRCLGAAVIMQWNSLPMTLQREIFDTAGSVGTLLDTAALRGQIARFLHKHRHDSDPGKI